MVVDLATACSCPYLSRTSAIKRLINDACVYLILYVYSKIIIGQWAFKAFACRRKSTNSQNREPPPPSSSPSCSLSGVELESPRNQQLQSNEPAAHLPGIGTIATSWVGHKGREQLMQRYSKDLETVRVSELQKELRNLASVCVNAFEKIQSTLPEATKAMILCKQHLPKARLSRDDSLSSAPLVDLWKETCSNSGNVAPADSVELATTVLGEKIVSTITEEHKEPPHVCF